ncbi:MAG: carboxypeptidase regulatory-like domain-containing protein [Gemmatimonas sp.]
MTAHHHALAWGVALLCALPVVGRAQSGTSATARLRLTGTVWDSTLSAPLAGASVQAVRADDPSQLRTGTADAKGNFRLDGLAPADYAVGRVPSTTRLPRHSAAFARHQCTQRRITTDAGGAVGTHTCDAGVW